MGDEAALFGGLVISVVLTLIPTPEPEERSNPIRGWKELVEKVREGRLVLFARVAALAQISKWPSATCCAAAQLGRNRGAADIEAGPIVTECDVIDPSKVGCASELKTATAQQRPRLDKHLSPLVRRRRHWCILIFASFTTPDQWAI